MSREVPGRRLADDKLMPRDEAVVAEAPEACVHLLRRDAEPLRGDVRGHEPEAADPFEHLAVAVRFDMRASQASGADRSHGFGIGTVGTVRSHDR